MVKRARTADSSSRCKGSRPPLAPRMSGDFSAAAATAAAERGAEESQQPRSILTLGSPCREAAGWQEESFGEFLRACATCKKAITEKDSVFMYGILLAFCSSECRNKQMKLDEDAERASKVLQIN